MNNDIPSGFWMTTGIWWRSWGFGVTTNFPHGLTKYVALHLGPLTVTLFYMAPDDLPF